MHDDPTEFLPLSATDLQVLLVLADGALHAYGIAKAVEQQPESRVRLEIGSLYRMLARLLADGLIEETRDSGDTPAAPTGKEARRRYYRITSFGRDVAEAETRRLASVLQWARSKQLTGAEGR